MTPLSIDELADINTTLYSQLCAEVHRSTPYRNPGDVASLLRAYRLTTEALGSHLYQPVVAEAEAIIAAHQMAEAK